MRAQGWMGMAVIGSAALLSGCSMPQRPIETIRSSGEYRFNKGDYAGARDEYAEILSRSPGDWQAQYMMGKAMLETGEYPAARRSLETAYTHQPNNREVANALAEAMYKQGDEARLFAFLRDRAASSQAVEDHLMLAEYAIELGDPDSAQTAIDTAIQIDAAKSTKPYLQAADLAERLGNLEEAVRRLRQAYGINPDDPSVRQRLQALGERIGDVTPLPPGR